MSSKPSETLLTLAKNKFEAHQSEARTDKRQENQFSKECGLKTALSRNSDFGLQCPGPMKRLFDIIVAVAGLVFLSPLLLLVGLLVKLDSRGPILFKQERIGKRFRPFSMYKFRTMHDGAHTTSALTIGADPRITWVGKYLRATKIDELPQLVNVLKGEMSLVGPRPEVPRYVELFRSDYEYILTVRPGLTDLASLKYSDEASILGESMNPEGDYVTRLLPDKIQLAKEYIQRSSFLFDGKLIVVTIIKLFGSSQTRSTKSEAH